MKAILLILLIATILGCSNQYVKYNNSDQMTNDELIEFAKANCFFWYFKKKGYDIDDIGSITGGIVEKGSYSADKFQQVAFLVKEYSPSVQSKHSVDIDLLKCFNLDQDPDFIQTINKLK